MNKNSVAFFKTENDFLIPKDCELIIAGWNISNTGNMGQIIRLGHNVGAKKVLFVQGNTIHRNSKIKKTAGFSFEQMDWSFIGESELNSLLTDGFSLVALETCDMSENVFKTPLPQKCILLAGNESHGLPEAIIEKSKIKVFVPMPGACKSMNVSHAISVAAFEWFRQHNLSNGCK